VEAAAAQRAQQEAAQANSSGSPTVPEDSLQTGAEANGVMEQTMAENSNQVFETYEGAGEVLLDLGDFGSTSASGADEFVLDIDLDEVPEETPAEAIYHVPAFARASASLKRAPSAAGSEWTTKPLTEEASTAAASSTAPSEFERVLDEPLEESAGASVAVSEEASPETSSDEGRVQVNYPPVSVAAGTDSPAAPSPGAAVAAPSGVLALGQLSPEIIDAIARRAVEQLSEKVVQEIAWEVVPQLAELLIKRQLEEKNS